MAPGTLGEEDSISIEKHRWGEDSKVYTRRFPKKSLKEFGSGDINGSKEVNQGAAVVDSGDACKNGNGRGMLFSLSENLSTDGAISTQPQPRPVLGSAVANGTGALKPAVTRVGDRVKINLEQATSASEIDKLKRKLVDELDQVRNFLKRVEAKEGELRRDSDALPATAAFSSDGSRYLLPRIIADDGSRGRMRGNLGLDSAAEQNSRPFRQLSVTVMSDIHGVNAEFPGREKRTPKASKYYSNSEFLLGKDRLPPENKKVKPDGGKRRRGKMDYIAGGDKLRKQVFRSCSKLLDRLMKHQYGWVFNSPVNAKTLGLHDYHDIIEHPMDLGTIKGRLAQKYYKFPKEFAEDVRLTFHNAMTYNPKGQDVHIMAELLLKMFEDGWKVIEGEYNSKLRYHSYQDMGLPLASPTSRKDLLRHSQPLVDPSMRTLSRLESMTSSANSKLKPLNLVPKPTALKKPKAKDLNKREMTYDEKQKLSTKLQSLPIEKLDNVVQIIKRRSSALSYHDDEVEVDIDSVDTETLWELDRFVTNYKKNLSKYKRKAEIALQKRAEASQNPQPIEKRVQAVPEAPRESKADNGNIATNTSVEGEKRRDNVITSSSSSSSSSDSDSSSSDSDSDSSSSNGSDDSHSTNT